MAATFRVGLTRDILDSRGEPAFGARRARDPRSGAGRSNGNTCRRWCREITADHAARYDALYVNIPRVPAARWRGRTAACASSRATASATTRSTSPAMTRAGVVVTHTPSSMPRPVATIALTFVLALAGKLFLKDRLTRTGRWHERMDHMGMGLTGRTLGVVGAGRIGKELLRMARAVRSEAPRGRPVRQCDRARLPRRAQGRSRHAAARGRFRRRLLPAERQTRHLIGAPQFALMKPTAYFINVARGPIVDEPALIDALRDGRIAGAGARRVRAGAGRIRQSAPRDGQRASLTPHSLCWTDECFHNMAATGLASIVDVLDRRTPGVRRQSRTCSTHPRVGTGSRGDAPSRAGRSSHWRWRRICARRACVRPPGPSRRPRDCARRTRWPRSRSRWRPASPRWRPISP